MTPKRRFNNVMADLDDVMDDVIAFGDVTLENVDKAMDSFYDKLLLIKQKVEGMKEDLA